MIIPITNSDDERLAPYRSIRHRDPSTGFIAEGSLVVMRLLQSEHSVHSLLLHTGQAHRYQVEAADNLPIYQVDPELGQSIAGYDFHRGVLAHGRCQPRHSLSQLIERRPALSLGLIAISDPENVGSLLRSAAAMGIHDIVIGPGTISPYVRRVIRVSMASVFQHRFYDLVDPVKEINKLQQAGMAFAATTLGKNSISIHELPHDGTQPLVLLVGNEANGLGDEVQNECRYRVTLPMASGTDSLNVGVAGAIFLHELSKPR